MQKYNWEELVDSYVDEECSVQEKRAIEERMLVDASVREAIQSAQRIRQALRSFSCVAPPELENRLTEALQNAPAWRKIERRSRVARRSEQARTSSFNLMKWVPSVVGGAVAASLLLGFGYAYHSLHIQPESKQTLVEYTPMSTTVEVVQQPLESPTVMTPSPANRPPEAAKRRSDSDFWIVVTLQEPQQWRKFTREFQNRCNAESLAFSKFGDGNEYLVEQTTPKQWAELVSWLETLGDTETSAALERWRHSSSTGVRSARVTFLYQEEQTL
ncbi:MAG: hypothetical protein Q4G03_02860 [Planctomycetia bacterium]|nr:hypothetical protein [Planctomycetia bacterium]